MQVGDAGLHRGRVMCFIGGVCQLVRLGSRQGGYLDKRAWGAVCLLPLLQDDFVGRCRRGKPIPVFPGWWPRAHPEDAKSALCLGCLTGNVLGRVGAAAEGAWEPGLTSDL